MVVIHKNPLDLLEPITHMAQGVYLDMVAASS